MVLLGLILRNKRQLPERITCLHCTLYFVDFVTRGLLTLCFISPTLLWVKLLLYNVKKEVGVKWRINSIVQMLTLHRHQGSFIIHYCILLTNVSHETFRGDEANIAYSANSKATPARQQRLPISPVHATQWNLRCIVKVALVKGLQ